MIKQVIRYSTIVLLSFTLVLFLLMIVRENSNDYTILILAISIIISVLYAFLKLRKALHHEHTEFESFKLVIWVPIGAVSTYFLNHDIGFGAAFAAAIVGSIASFIPNLNKKSSYLQGLPTAIYCGAFVGMSKLNVASGYPFILSASFFTGVCLMVSKSVLQGVGGKLGALAFIGVTLSYFLLMLLKR